MSVAEKNVTEKDVKGKTFVAKAEAVVINVGTKVERYVYKHAVIPAETDTKELIRLVRRGLVVEKADAPAADAAPVAPSA